MGRRQNCTYANHELLLLLLLLRRMKIADVDDEAMEIIIIKLNWFRYKGGIYTESVIQLHMCSLSHICGFICDPNQTRLSFKENT